MTRFIIAALAALALVAPAASADPHWNDANMQAQQRDSIDSPAGELRARGRDGVQTGSLAGTTDATTRALAQERAYSSYGEPAPIQPAPSPATSDDGEPWPLIGAGVLGVALLFGGAVALVARPRRTRVA
jgi:hypothetical protein